MDRIYLSYYDANENCLKLVKYALYEFIEKIFQYRKNYLMNLNLIRSKCQVLKVTNIPQR